MANKVFGIASDALKQCIEKIERLESEKVEVQAAIRDVYSEAKATGFDPKVIKQIIRERKMSPQDLDEQELLLATYKRALGMLPELDEVA
jgi:uncharacterized protein (UPF0335 family)